MPITSHFQNKAQVVASLTHVSSVATFIDYNIFSLRLQNDVEMPIPKYFVLEKAKALKEREKLLGQILSRLGAQDRDAVR